MAFAVAGGAWSHATPVDDASSSKSALRPTWAVSRPESGRSAITLHEDDDYAAVAFGEIFGAANCATTAAAAFRTTGATGVRLMNGSFSAVIWDKRRREATVVSDLIGQRTLRLSETSDAFWLSPHEACLVAAGAALVEFDPVSVLSSLVIENSILGKSLLLGVTALSGRDVLTWSAGSTLTTTRCQLLDLNERINARDVRGQEQCRTRVIDEIVSSAAAWASSSGNIRCELTAGIDSRATLACLLAADVGERVIAVTSGAPDTVDMKTAIKLARLAGVRHEVIAAPSDSPEDFLVHLRLRAFTMNGDTDAKRATKPLPNWRPEAFTRVEGSSGEVFRGFYYPYFGPTGNAPSSISQLTRVLLTRRCRRFGTTPVADPRYRTQLHERLEQCFESYRQVSHDGNDMLDLFYLFERTARWAAHVRRSSWSSTRNVFLVPSAIREAYRMPSPWGTTVGVHAPLIFRHFPASRWVLINGTKPLQLEGPGRLRMATRLALTVAQKFGDKALRRVAGKTIASPVDLLFAGPLLGALADLTAQSDSIIARVLGPEGIRKVLDDHRARHKHGALLGYAATIDAYRRLLLDVRP